MSQILMPEFMSQQNQISSDAEKSRVDKRIRVLLADDHTIVRQGLCSLLRFEADFEVVGEAENGLRVIELARQRNTEVVIMDINMPVMNGIEPTQILTKKCPKLRPLRCPIPVTRPAAARLCIKGVSVLPAQGAENITPTRRRSSRRKMLLL